MAGFVVGLYYLHLWLGNTLVGLLGGLLDKMPAAQFWLLHAGLVAAAGVVFFVVSAVLRPVLRGEAPSPDDRRRGRRRRRRNALAPMLYRPLGRHGSQRLRDRLRRGELVGQGRSSRRPRRSGWSTPPSTAA